MLDIAYWPVLLLALALIVCALWLLSQPPSVSRAAKVLSDHARRRGRATKAAKTAQLRTELGK